MSTAQASAPSTSSLHAEPSITSQHLKVPSIRTNVLTVPPWARDEPPSPKENFSSSSTTHLGTVSDVGRMSDVASYNSTNNSRWWSFTSRRPRDPSPDHFPVSPARSERRPFNFRERSVNWLPPSSSRRESARRDRDDSQLPSTHSRPAKLSIALPPPPTAPFTLSHNATPGWETPWTSRPNAQGPFRDNLDGPIPNDLRRDQEKADSQTSLDTWKKRRKRYRKLILHNTYVPLLFRFINLTFTAAALALAIRIRIIESRNHARGAVGSSPIIVIIFAPLTLVHVMSAVYLEYFGRPLGLWRTSAKMFATLIEVVFICAWSASLSLCFDNFFTSLIPCASGARISWYNELPRPRIDLLNIEGTDGDRICDDQLALICLVAFGLVTYCINLVISLFRILEKVKYHPGSVQGWRAS